MSDFALLHPLSDFVQPDEEIPDTLPLYWYEGHCPQTNALLRLPRTAWVEAIAHGLIQQLAIDPRYGQEGKMYGVLLVELPSGKRRVLKAFSGLLLGDSEVEGWVPPIPGRGQVALEEARTLIQLEAMKQELIALQQIPERQQYAAAAHDFEAQLEQLSQIHRQDKQNRQQQRQQYLETLSGAALTTALKQLDDQSRQEGIARRHLKQQRNRMLQPLKQAVEQADQRIRELKQQRKALSRQLQSQMHAVYRLSNFAGESLPLQQLMPHGSMPTGTGDCCAPKLLHYAATHQLKPLAMAEFWWGTASARGDKVPGEFYGACVERCQPLMGFLLSGLPHQQPIAPPPTHFPDLRLTLLYEDEWLVAVNKPAGLLSVPGRYGDRQDSVLSRLQCSLPNSMALSAVHRLDQETSGILLLARNPETDRQLRQLFQQRQVHKVYEAILAGRLMVNQGVIDLPLWADPDDRPRQKVDEQRGKRSTTHYRAIAYEEAQTRVELVPVTGRTHQLRVHAADPRGFGIPILGDRLYGCPTCATRLHLHARELSLTHPQTQQLLSLHTQTPF